MILSFALLQAKKFVGNKGRCEGGAGVKHSITASTVVMGLATKDNGTGNKRAVELGIRFVEQARYFEWAWDIEYEGTGSGRRQ